MLTTVCFPPEVLDVGSPDVALRHPPELVSVLACADHLRTKCTLFSNTGLDESTDLSQVDVHPVFAGDKVAVAGLPISQLYQHRVVLRSAQQ